MRKKRNKKELGQIEKKKKKQGGVLKSNHINDTLNTKLKNIRKILLGWIKMTQLYAAYKKSTLKVRTHIG